MLPCLIDNHCIFDTNLIYDFCCAVQDNQGGKTQIAGLISCSLILVVLVAIGPYFKTLPNVSPLFLLFCASGSNIHA